MARDMLADEANAATVAAVVAVVIAAEYMALDDLRSKGGIGTAVIALDPAEARANAAEEEDDEPVERGLLLKSSGAGIGDSDEGGLRRLAPAP